MKLKRLYMKWQVWRGKALDTWSKSPYSTTEEKKIIINGHEAVDLGLSVKWATCNVGAESPKQYGGYYAWGETEPKDNYTEDTYKYYDKKKRFIHIGKDISGTKYDVARVQWGGDWRMPRLEEFKELDEKCSWLWTNVNGIKGYKVTGPNGNSIFFPAAGCRILTDVVDCDSYGNFWCATKNELYINLAYYFYFDSGDHYWYDGEYCGDGSIFDNSYRFIGRTVRPVTDK